MSESNLTKCCTSCDQTKPTTAFNKQRAGLHGVESWCRECRKAYQRANKEHYNAVRRRWYQEHKEEAAEYQRQYRKEHAEKRKADRKRYYEENKERIIEKNRRDRRADPDKAAARDRASYQRRREKARAQQADYNKRKSLERRVIGAKYRARKENAEGSHTADEVWQMYEDQQGLCAYCEMPLFGEFQVDHMVPLSKGGRDDWRNLAIACPRCNISKKDGELVVFMRRLVSRL